MIESQEDIDALADGINLLIAALNKQFYDASHQGIAMTCHVSDKVCFEHLHAKSFPSLCLQVHSRMPKLDDAPLPRELVTELDDGDRQ